MILGTRLVRRPSCRACLLDPTSRGFSLLELLIVMCIIIVMYSLYFSPGTKSEQTRRKEACNKNLQNIYVALKTYSLDHNDFFPVLTNAATSEPPLSELIPRYTTGAGFFICPGSSDSSLPETKPFANRKISYAYYMGRVISEGASAPLVSDEQVNTLPKTARQPLFSSDGKKPGNNHKKFGGNVMFCDGSVQLSPPLAAFPLPCPTNVLLLNPRL